jgi:hypothetical protein
VTKGSGRPNIKRAVAGKETGENTQRFLNHGKKEADDIFGTPGKPVMGGGRRGTRYTLSAAAKKFQDGGTAQTSKIATQSANEESEKRNEWASGGGDEMVVADEDE